jgi:hypothetical protein
LSIPYVSCVQSFEKSMGNDPRQAWRTPVFK